MKLQRPALAGEQAEERDMPTSTNTKEPLLFGIPNCDTVKKARTWLDDHQVAYQFHDFKKQGLPLAQADQWIKAVGYDKLLNRRGPTWRKLDPAVQASVVDAASALAVMQLNTSVIKRPVVQWPDGQITVGFDAAAWALHLSH
jgi:arsenate reductase (glutaredoxin)